MVKHQKAPVRLGMKLNGIKHSSSMCEGLGLISYPPIMPYAKAGLMQCWSP